MLSLLVFMRGTTHFKQVDVEPMKGAFYLSRIHTRIKDEWKLVRILRLQIQNTFKQPLNADI